MTTANTIITGALTFHLNRLSPGETLDADLGNVCLAALNDIVDEINGGRSMLFRTDLTTGTIGGTWSTITPGTKIDGATYNDGDSDIKIDPITMAQYHAIADKTESGMPQVFAYDGYGTIYFYPSTNGTSITLRTFETVASFADLSTDYGMPEGYRSGLSAMLAEKLAPSTIGGITRDISRASFAARLRLKTQNVNPAIIRGASSRPNIITGP